MAETSHALAGVLARAVHIAAVIVLIGGIFSARFLGLDLTPALRNAIYAAIVLVTGSGLYNLLTKASYPPGYHVWFGIKMLLVLHIFAAAIVACLHPNEGRRRRTLTGLVVSAAAVILISAWLRWMSLFG